MPPRDHAPHHRNPMRRGRRPRRAAVQRFSGYRRNSERQRRKKKVDASYKMKSTVFRERVAKDYKFAK